MDGTIRASGPARNAIAGAIAVAYFGLSLLQGAYATTSVAWMLIAIWALVAAGIVFRAWPGARAPRLTALAAGSFAGLAVFSLVSMAWANDAGRAFTSAVLPAMYAGLLLLVVLVTPIAGARRWLEGLAIGATGVCALALASRLDPGFLGTTDFAPGSAGLGAAARLAYPIGYWNGVGSCAAAAIVLLVWLGARATQRRDRAAAVAALPIGGLVLYLTSSRGGVLAVVLGVAVLVALGPRRMPVIGGFAIGLAGAAALVALVHHEPALLHDLRTPAQRHEGVAVAGATIAVCALCGLVRWHADGWFDHLSILPRVGWAAVGTLVAALVAALVIANPSVQLHRFEEVGGKTSAAPGHRSLLASTGSGRAQFWHAALDAFASHPAGGVGASNYELYWNAHPKAPIVTGNAHSFFLEALADLGPLGLILSIGPFAVALLAARRAWRAAPALVAPALAVLATATVGSAIDWTWLIPVAFAPAVIAMGLLTGASAGADREGHLLAARPSKPSGVGQFGLGVLALLFAWGAIWVSGIALYASARLDASRAAVGRGDLSAAASAAQDAASVEPFSPEPQLQLALTYARAGERRRARDAATAATEKASEDWRTWALLAAIDRQRGARAAATLEGVRAQNLAPVLLPRNLGVQLG